MILLFAMYLAGFVLGAGTLYLSLRKTITLGRTMAKAQLLYVRIYTKVDAIYLAGAEPMTIYPGRVEVLYFPLDAKKTAEENDKL